MIDGVNISVANLQVLDSLLSDPDVKSEVIADFWRCMIVCFNTPRPSTNYDGVNKEERTQPFRNVCSQVCANAGLAYLEDATGNIIVKNFTDPTLVAKYCFQGHMDIVVSRNESVIHNFEIDGVDVQITSERTVKPAKGITLGADNGVAIACGLSILKNHKSIPLELLITKNEETSFDGACGVDPSLISANTILNLDSEVEKAICVGSAGGFEQRFSFILQREPADQNLFEIKLRDLKGGHSGIDIDNERTNGILALSRLLAYDGLRLVSIRGGTSSNAIPREASAVIAAEDYQIENLKTRFDELEAELSMTEPGISLEVKALEKNSVTVNPATVYSSRRLLGLIFSLGSGVARKLAGDVESSFNLGVVSTDEDKVTLRYLVRSTSVSWMKSFAKQLTLIGELSGAEVEEFVGFFGAWEPQYKSKIVSDLIKVHPCAGAKIKPYTVHAGLECSTILEKFAEVGRTFVECASIGPQIENAHSPDECLFIDSAAEFVHWVNNLVTSA